MSASGMDRLARAMSIWLDNQTAAEPRSPDELLAEHEDLRDLLEPLEQGEGATPAPPDAEGVTLDDFRIVGEIGRGGMGIVYEARQLSLDRRVALKLLPHSTLLTPKAIARFKREALTAARVDHPGIVNVLAVGDSERGHWFAMELLDGVTLDEFARQCRDDSPDTAVGEIVAVVALVAEALAHAHGAGVVHRDIKPSNVLVRGNTPVITDFGVAHESTLPSMTQTGELAGTPFYVSPEQVAGRDVDARSDVFSLGVTLYELLTQKRPFDGESSREVLDQIVRRDPPGPDRIDTDLPRDLSAIVLKALEKNPAQRYRSAKAMADDLRRFLTHRPVQAQPIGWLGRGRRWTRREPLKATLAATLLVGALTVTGLMSYVWWTQQATDIGRDTLRSTQVERMLLDAVVSRMTVDGDKKPALVPAVLELASDDPYVLANAAIYYERRREHGPTRSLEILRGRPTAVDDPGLYRLERWLQERLKDGKSAGVDVAELDEIPRSPLDAYILAELSIVMVGHAMRTGDGELRETCADKAVQFALHAISTTERPRSQYFVVLQRAGRMIQDAKPVLMAVDAMTRHWPQSTGAWAFRAMGWDNYAMDAEIGEMAAKRSLELSPDNLCGLEVMAAIEERRGNTAEAVKLRAKMQELYPEEMAWRRGAIPHTGK